ncbi:MAG: choice-of-anchor D domain-containing protein [Betaproteobacteria bacterium]
MLVALALAATAMAPPAYGEEAPDHAVLDADAPLAERVPKFLFTFDEPVRWSGTIGWKYNPTGAPVAFADTASTVARLQAGLNHWKSVCGVATSYQGTTTTAPNDTPGNQPDLQNVVGWAPLQGSTAGITWTWYQSQGGMPSLIDGDIILSPSLVTTNGSMDRVAVHEWGHLLGLAHSGMNGAVMSGPQYSSYNNLAALTDDDVRGCRCLYGAAAGQSAGLLCTLPREVAFGSVPAGSSAPRSLTLQNNGDASLTLQAMSFTSGAFGASGCAAGTVLAPTQACVLSLAFTPATSGDFAATLSIPVAGEAQPYRIALSGTGTAPTGPAPSLAPSSAAFASQAVGTTSMAKTLTLTNAGGGLLNVTGFTPAGSHPGDFNRAGTCALGTSLGAGVSCTIQLAFTPSASGSRSATLAVAVSSGSVPVIVLSGSGAPPAVPPALGVSSASLAFADQQAGTPSASQSVIVTNTGGGTLTLASIGVAGAAAADFSRTGNCNAGSALSVAQSCTASIRFVPTSAGAKAASLDIATNAGMASIALAGNAIAPPSAPIASFGPASIDFGELAVGTPGDIRFATISNVGSAPLVLAGVALTGGHSGDFPIVSSCPAGTTLQPAQSCAIALRFLPQAGGARSASLRVSHNAAGSPSTVALAGTGNAPATPSTVVEYYHADYDHYFITIAPEEIAALDTGVFGGWSRTGLAFNAHGTAQPGFAPICRFYLPPGWGDSHFYSASPAECTVVQQQHPAFILESTSVMHLAIPDPVAGSCPPGADPVYRVWNHRPDTNHRYTSLRAVRDAMVAAGYVAEGSGPDIVTFCAPR